MIELAGQNLIVCYEGEVYEANYTASPPLIRLELLLADVIVYKKTVTVPGQNAESLARMMALEILRKAKLRGELA